MIHFSFANSGALPAGAEILALLGILSVWIWALAAAVAIDLHEARKPGGGNLVALHARICERLLPGSLRKRSRRALLEIHVETLMKSITGRVGTILLLAGMAPLLGLLGTVEGMIDNFGVMARIGASDSSQLTAGISKALVTTQAGLLVAIPGLLVGGVLYRKASKLRNTLYLTGSREQTCREES
jgi:biopolymer transport protein ExbB